MNDIFNILNKPKANPNRNGFDLGSFFPFSLKLGQVKPIAYFHTVPKGRYRLSVDELTHTEPFITDPFVRLTKHIEFIFVPYSQLWHGSSQFFGHAQDPQSSYEQGHDYVPNFSLGNMLERIWTLGTNPLYRDLQGLAIQETALSLLDMLGYGAHPLYKMSDGNRTNYINSLKDKYVNAWALLAYNKYWNTYLRDTQHTSPLNPAIFNADKVPCTSVATSHMDNYYTDVEMLQLVTIKYRKVKKDIFTSALTSRQFGAVEGVQINFDLSQASIVGNGSQIGNTEISTKTIHPHSLSTESSSVVTHQGTNFDKPSGGTVGALFYGEENKYLQLKLDGFTSSVNSLDGSLSALSLSGNPSASFDVYTLLTAQMMQKWREQIQRAGNQTEDRLRALYGVSPASDAKNQPYIIGSTSYTISANQVTSTGEGANTKLGDIAAKGIGYAERNSFEFEATEFGVILVCTYILPENNYLAPIDKLSTLVEPFDYYTEQLENLGLTQIEEEFRHTLVYAPATDDYHSISEYSPGTFPLPGFAARYWEYKQKPNVVHLGFEHGQENSKWIPSRLEYQSNGVLDPYYVAPNEYDTVFGTQTDFHLDTDQFVGAARLSCDAVLPMSELGLPRW